MNLNNQLHDIPLRIPILGMVVFLLLYILAAVNYPGGSYLDPTHPGFSLTENYLCDLLDDRAVNGKSNDARAYARASLGVLCFSLMLLWVYLPKLFDIRKGVHVLISSFGILSMGITLFLEIGGHDIIVRVAGIFGAIALLLSFWQLYQARKFKLLLLGIVSLILVGFNYYLYETGAYLNVLPLLQKFTFVSCLAWFFLLNLSLLKRVKKLRQ